MAGRVEREPSVVRYLADLEQRLANVERHQPVGGVFVVKWASKGFVSKQEAIPTGLTSITAITGQAFFGSAAATLGLVSISGGTATWEVRTLIELAAGAEVGCYFIATGA